MLVYLWQGKRPSMEHVFVSKFSNKLCIFRYSCIVTRRFFCFLALLVLLPSRFPVNLQTGTRMTTSSMQKTNKTIMKTEALGIKWNVQTTILLLIYESLKNWLFQMWNSERSERLLFFRWNFVLSARWMQLWIFPPGLCQLLGKYWVTHLKNLLLKFQSSWSR